jgi:preprotein translocase subunit YajC
VIERLTATAIDDEIKPAQRLRALELLGKVTEAGDQFLTIEVADGVRIKVQRHTVTSILPKGTFKNA